MKNNIKGKKYGDYIATSIVGKDNSRHLIWEFKCKYCGRTIRSTHYNVTHNRVNIKCPCQKNKTNNLNQNDLNNDLRDFCITPLTNDNINNNKKENKNNKINKDNKESHFGPYYLSDYKVTFISDDDEIDILPFISQDKINNNNNNNIKDNNQLNITNEDIGIKTNIKYEFKNMDLLDLPVYYHIAHCIPADGSFGGKTAQRINSLYNLKEKIIQEDLQLQIGDVIWIDNVFNLIAAEKKFKDSDYPIIRQCITNLVKYCFDYNITYLGMTKLASGKMGLLWDVVKTIVMQEFEELYNSEFNINDKKITITFCQND